MVTLPTEKKIIAPEEGWKESSYYLVDVSWNVGNPIHRSIFYTGFLNGKNGGPGGYNQVLNPTYDGGDFTDISRVYYMKVIRLLLTKEDMEIE